MSYKEKYLTYNDGKDLLPEGSFRISPSSFNTFMTRSHLWWREQVLEEDGFTGNTASVIGTIVHSVAAAYANGEEIDQKAITRYAIDEGEKEDVDTDIVLKDYKSMAEVLINDYVAKNTATRVEDFIYTDLGDRVVVGGSVDVLDGTMVVDFKTYNAKSKPKSIPMNYKYQLLCYAYIYTKQGVDIDRIRLVYVNRPIDGGISEKTGKPLKSYPPEVTVLTESITQEDIDFIEGVLFLCRDTYLAAIENPSLVYMLFKDYRLKENK